MKHENRIDIPWVTVRLSNHLFHGNLDIIDHMDFDNYSKPRMDAHKWWIFSLKDSVGDVCMIRCRGSAARDYALNKVNQILDAKEPL